MDTRSLFPEPTIVIPHQHIIKDVTLSQMIKAFGPLPDLDQTVEMMMRVYFAHIEEGMTYQETVMAVFEQTNVGQDPSATFDEVMLVRGAITQTLEHLTGNESLIDALNTATLATKLTIYNPN